MRRIICGAILAAAVMMATDAGAADFAVTSASYPEGGQMAAKYACTDQGGSDTSIQLSWSGAPAGTQAFAIIMDDPDAQSVVGYTWVHWNVFNIPAATTSVAETANGRIEGAVTTRNSFSTTYYGGPCPPNGTHTYITAVYALKGALGEPPNGITRGNFDKKFAGKILAKAETKGTFP